MTWLKKLMAALIATSAAACSSSLDWREFTPEGSGIVAAFPCRPDRLAREVPLAGVRLHMQMHVCAAEGVTYALSFVDVADPSGVAAALAELRAVAASNVRGVQPQATPLQIPGMTTNQNSARVSVGGRLPDGAPVQLDAAFFAHGLRVYQATAVGARLQPDALQTFFGALRFSV